MNLLIIVLFVSGIYGLESLEPKAPDTLDLIKTPPKKGEELLLEKSSLISS